MLKFYWTQGDNTSVHSEIVVNLIKSKFCQSPNCRIEASELRKFFETSLGITIPPRGSNWKFILQSLREELHLVDKKIHWIKEKGYIYGIQFKH